MRALSTLLVMAAVCGLGYVLGHAFTDRYPVTVAAAVPQWVMPSDDAAVGVAAPVTQQKASKSTAPAAAKPAKVPRLRTLKIHTTVSHLPVRHAAVYVPHPRVSRAWAG